VKDRLVSGAVGTMVTLVLTWAAFMRDVPTRADVVFMIDRAPAIVRAEELMKISEEIKADVRGIKKDVADIRVEIAKKR